MDNAPYKYHIIVISTVYSCDVRRLLYGNIMNPFWPITERVFLWTFYNDSYSFFFLLDWSWYSEDRGEGTEVSSGMVGCWLVPNRLFVPWLSFKTVAWVQPWRQSRLSRIYLLHNIFFVFFRDPFDISVQMSVEMPFEIRTLDSPTHAIRTKVTFIQSSFVNIREQWSY